MFMSKDPMIDFNLFYITRIREKSNKLNRVFCWTKGRILMGVLEETVWSEMGMMIMFPL